MKQSYKLILGSLIILLTSCSSKVTSEGINDRSIGCSNIESSLKAEIDINYEKNTTSENKVTTTSETVSIETIIETVIETEIVRPPYNSNLKELVKQEIEDTKNQDVIGWIRINDIGINQPILRGTDNDYYLSHGSNKEDKSGGSIFADYRCVYGYANDNDCLILYGHNMPDNTVFGNLDKYREPNYYKTHKYFEVSSRNNDHLYEIVGAFQSYPNMDTADFDWWNYLDFENEGVFNYWKSQVENKNSLCENKEIDIVYGDKLCILCTCYDSIDSTTRYVIVAKEVL